MHRIWIAALGLGLAVALVHAGQDPKAQSGKPGTPAEEFKAISKEWDDTVSQVRKQLGEAKSEEERDKMLEKALETLVGPSEKAIRLAEKHPKDPVAKEALTWAFQRLERNPAAGSEKLLRSVMEKGTTKEAQGLAAFSLAKRFDALADGEEDEKKAEKLREEAAKVYETVLAKYADVEGKDGPIGKAAKAALSLGIGKEVPDIEGQDADGKKFKLSDYRGKVVLLDFWGNW
jgi:hypothetical protein